MNTIRYILFVLMNCLVSANLLAGAEIFNLAPAREPKGETLIAAQISPVKGKTTTAAIYKSLRAKFDSEPRIFISIVRTARSPKDAVLVKMHSAKLVEEVYYFVQTNQMAWDIRWMNNSISFKNDIDLDDENAVRRKIHALLDSGLGVTHPRVQALNKILNELERKKIK